MPAWQCTIRLPTARRLQTLAVATGTCQVSHSVCLLTDRLSVCLSVNPEAYNPPAVSYAMITPKKKKKNRTLLDTGDVDPAEALLESCNIALRACARQSHRDSSQRTGGRSKLDDGLIISLFDGDGPRGHAATGDGSIHHPLGWTPTKTLSNISPAMGSTPRPCWMAVIG